MTPPITTSSARQSVHNMLSPLSPIQKRRRPAGKRFPDEIPESPWRVPGGSSSNNNYTTTPAAVDDANASALSSRRLILQMRGMQLEEHEEVAVVEGESPDNMDIELHPAVKRRRSSADDDLDEEVHDQDTDMGAMESDALARRGNAKGKAKTVVMLDGDSSPTNGQGSRRLRSPPPDSSPAKEAPEEAGKSMDTSKEDEDLSDDVEGYGIAYAPTPQQRDIRRQKRLQQIRDYKTRESREARQRRIEQRRRRRSSSLAPNGLSSSNNQKKDSSDEGKKKSVHFHI